jgi:ABC-2 type transport system permease protein
MMCFRLFRAEWLKIIGNRWVSGCMIWIFPALAVLATVLMLLAAAFSASFREGLSLEPMLWTDVAILAWLIPNNPLGLGLLLGFTAVLFAGEYQWNTWKLIVPRSRRVPLILMKFFTVGFFIVFAFTLMSILLTLGMGLVSLAAGASYKPSLADGVLTQFAKDYGLQMFYAFVSTMIAAGYASLAAMITRSILGSVITSIVITIGQTLLILPLYLISYWLDTDFFLHIYRFIPSYNLLNLFTWLVDETPDGLELTSGAVVVDSLLFSEVVLIAWVIGLVTLTAYLFYRQDITN